MKDTSTHKLNWESRLVPSSAVECMVVLRAQWISDANEKYLRILFWKRFLFDMVLLSQSEEEFDCYKINNEEYEPFITSILYVGGFMMKKSNILILSTYIHALYLHDLHIMFYLWFYYFLLISIFQITDNR